MKPHVFIYIAFRIIILFGSGMLISYINPSLRDILGDTPCVGKHCTNSGGYNWGAPHYWYQACCIALFILSAVNTIWAIREIIKKNYPDDYN